MNSKLLLNLAILLISVYAQAQIKPGLWKTECLNGLMKSQTLGEDFKIELNESFYQDAACEKPAFAFNTRGSVSFYTDQSTFIDFIYDEVFMVLHKQGLIDDFNSRIVCGIKNWKISEPQNITGLKCAIFNIGKELQIPRKNDLKFGIYEVKNNSLFYGKLSSQYDGNTPEKRPQQLNTAIEYIFRNSP